MNFFRHVLISFLGLLFVAVTNGKHALGCEQRLKVVELFTSQGCSSCSQADRLLGELAARNDLLALSLHVDYWDYLGWKDPFASTVATQRQRDYARLLALHYVYTPQMVVQGKIEAAGGDRPAVMQAIDGAPSPVVPIVLSWRSPGQLVVSAGSGEATPAVVWVAVFDRLQMTRVGAGENGGRELANFNVLRSLMAVGQWNGRPLEAVADMAEERWNDGTCAALLQADGTGTILGAARCGR